MSKNIIPQTEVLAWLAEHHPEIHATCEIERDWVWITANLKDLPAVRESIKPYGFRYCHKGHALPCGKVGKWAHHCEKPVGYRKGKGGGKKSSEQSEQLSELEMAMLA